MSIWTPTLDSALASGVADDMTAQQISDSLRISRNAVLGRIKRLRDSGDSRFPFAGAAARRLGRPLANPAPARKPAPRAMPQLGDNRMAGLPLWSAADFHSRRQTLDELRPTSCRWIDSRGEDAEPTYCGQTVHRRSYCQHHFALAYRVTERMPIRALTRFADRFPAVLREEVAA